MLNSKPRRPIVLSLLSFLAAILACEVILRIVPPVRVYMLTRQVIQQELSIPSEATGYLPRSLSTFRFRNREFDTVVTINSRSLRDSEYPYTRPTDRYRIVVLGDSMTFGWGVDQEDIVTEVLEHRYVRNTDVINMSVSGFDTFQELRWFQTEGVRYEPQLVLLFWYDGNDLTANNTVPRYTFRKGRMYEDETGLSAAMVAWRRLKRTSYVAALCSLLDPKPRITQDVLTSQWNRLRTVLEQLKSSVEASSGRLAVIGVPWKHRLVPNHHLAELLDDLKVPYIDLGIIFSRLSVHDQRALFFRLDFHWSPKGHAVAARELARYLYDTGLIPTTYWQEQ